MATDLAGQVDELGDPAVRGLEVPPFELAHGIGGRKLDDGAQPFLSLVGPIEPRIRVGDELQGCGLPLGEVVRILA